MVSFPALRPATVQITPGVVPVTVQAGYDGSTTTSTADLVPTGDALDMTFEGITEAQARGVVDHQTGEQGRAFLFTTTTLAAELTPAGYRWTYARPISQDDIHAVTGSEFYRLSIQFLGVRIRRSSTPSGSVTLQLRTTAAKALPAGSPSASVTLRLTTTPAGMATDTPSQLVLLLLRTTPADVVIVPPPTVLTFTATSGTNVPVPNLLANPRPVQLNSAGLAMNTGATPNERNFIYLGLTCNDASAGNWRPVNQSTSTQGEQRFDYYFNTATTSTTTGGVSGLVNQHNWSNRLNLRFGSFYLDGTASFCGPSNAVAVVDIISTGEAVYINESNNSTVGNSVAGNQNTITSSVYSIVFGASGITGTLQFTAFTNVTTNPFRQLSGGVITLSVDP